MAARVGADLTGRARHAALVECGVPPPSRAAWYPLVTARRRCSSAGSVEAHEVQPGESMRARALIDRTKDVHCAIAIAIALAGVASAACSSAEDSSPETPPAPSSPTSGDDGDGNEGGEPPAPAAPPPPVAPAAKHALTISYAGLKNDPYRNDKKLFVRARVLVNGAAKDFESNVQSTTITNGKGTVVFSGVPEARVQVDVFVDVDGDAKCSSGDFSNSFTSQQALTEDREESFSILQMGCMIADFPQ